MGRDGKISQLLMNESHTTNDENVSICHSERCFAPLDDKDLSFSEH